MFKQRKYQQAIHLKDEEIKANLRIANLYKYFYELLQGDGMAQEVEG